MGFGLWFEPEVIGPSAQIRHTHPEWLHTIGGRATPPDQRAILQLGVPEARAYMRERIVSILQATGAVWMKWDFNSHLFQGGWAPDLPEELTHQDPLLAHYAGVYQLQDELRAALPALTLEMCSSGGGRFDPAILSHGHTNWMSDETQPLPKLAMHFGSQLVHCAVVCNDWLTEWPPYDPLGELFDPPRVDERGDLAFRTRVAMLGTFGISAPIARWTAADVATVKTHVAWYKDRLRPILHGGDQFLLTEPPPLDGQGAWAAVWYVAKDAQQGALFAFRLAGTEAQRSFPLPALMLTAQYRLQTPEGWSTVRSGADLSSGLTVSAETPFSSVLLHVQRL
jgi:alpha-galactosidase